ERGAAGPSQLHRQPRLARPPCRQRAERRAECRTDQMRFGLIISEAASGLRRNLSMVVSVVLVTFISLTFVGAAGMLQMQINQMKGYWYDKVQVAVFLCVDTSTAASCASGPVTDEQRAEIEATLTSPAVEQYVDTYLYESQEDALGHFRDQ